MERTELIEKVNAILQDEFEADMSAFKPDASLVEVLDLDSLDIVDLVVIVESNFGIKMKKEDFKSVRTFSELYDFLEAGRK